MSSFFTPKEDMKNFLNAPSMNDFHGFQVFLTADKSVADLLPPPLELADPKNPCVYLYIADIRKPTFAKGYREGGLGVLAKYGDYQGIYFFNLMLAGDGAETATVLGRENAGIPKKIADAIVLERDGIKAHCYIDRGGVRLCDAEMTMGSYDIPFFHAQQEGCTPEAPKIVKGGSFYYKYDMTNGVHDVRLYYYGSDSPYYSWEPARCKVTLASSVNDPWGEVPIKSAFLAGWEHCDNPTDPAIELYRVPEADTNLVMQYLFAGRFDQEVLG